MYRQHIDELQAEMKTLITAFTPIGLERYAAVFKNKDEKALYEFLVDFRSNEYAELYRIFRLPLDTNQPDAIGYELWNKYFKHGKTNLVEVNLFLKQARVCRDKWKKIKADKNVDCKDSERVNT